MFVVYLLIAIVFIVVSTTKFKLHPFLALIFAALGYGLLSGMEFSDIVASVNNGFGNIVGYIGIVIIIGCIIGTFLEESGGAYIMARSVIRFSGEKRVPLAMLILGYIISIPVYADSGFVILSPLNKALTKRAGLSLACTVIALSLGLTITHCLVTDTFLENLVEVGANLLRIEACQHVNFVPDHITNLARFPDLSNNWGACPDLNVTIRQQCRISPVDLLIGAP